MRLTEIRELFAYDTWANDLMFDAAERLSEDELHRDLATSYESVFGTLLHVVGAEEVWLSRWLGNPVNLPGRGERSTLQALRERWDGARNARDTFVESLDEGELDERVPIVTTAGKTYQHSYRQMFQHVANHSSYHRGQIVTLLRQLGHEPPTTDLIYFYRLNQ